MGRPGLGRPPGNRRYPKPPSKQAGLKPACSDLHQQIFGADSSIPTGVAGARLRVGGQMSELPHSCLLIWAGYGTGPPTYLFQPTLGLG